MITSSTIPPIIGIPLPGTGLSLLSQCPLIYPPSPSSPHFPSLGCWFHHLAMLFPLPTPHLLRFTYVLPCCDHLPYSLCYRRLGTWCAVGEIIHQAMVAFLVHPQKNQRLTALSDTNKISDRFYGNGVCLPFLCLLPLSD